MKSRTVKLLRKKVSKAFTLVELLVVISIIALLLSILMPSLSRARELAKNVVCQSNLKQWNLCFKMFLADNENRFTPGVESGDWYGQLYWIYMLKPYFQNDKIFECPNATKEGKAANALGSSDALSYSGTTTHKWFVNDIETDTQYSGSYGMNGWVRNAEENVGWRPSSWYWKSDLVPAHIASKVPLFGDCIWALGHPTETDEPRREQKSLTWSNMMNRFLIPRHTGDSVNFVFLDGSVGKTKLKELWALKWYREFDTKNNKTLDNYDWPEWLK